MSKIDALLKKQFIRVAEITPWGDDSGDMRPWINEAKQELLSAILSTKPKYSCSGMDIWEQNITDLFIKEEK